MIAVSGWLLDTEDYKRMYGVVPDEMTLEVNLILSGCIILIRKDLKDSMKSIVLRGSSASFQFFAHSVRLPKVQQEAIEWRNDPHHLMEQV
jgi:hypothetical protein